MGKMVDVRVSVWVASLLLIVGCGDAGATDTETTGADADSTDAESGTSGDGDGTSGDGDGTSGDGDGTSGDGDGTSGDGDGTSGDGDGTSGDGDGDGFCLDALGAPVCVGDTYCCDPTSPGAPCCTNNGVIPCGAETCDTATEFCLGCVHTTGNDTHCWTRTDPDIFVDSGIASNAHGCSVQSLFLGCDGPGDCAASEECVFSAGENAWSFCAAEGLYTFGVACNSSADCPTAAPTCAPFNEFGYVAPFVGLLGWTPMACQ